MKEDLICNLAVHLSCRLSFVEEVLIGYYAVNLANRLSSAKTIPIVDKLA